MKSLRHYILLLLFFASALSLSASLSAEDILKKSSASMLKGGGIVASYTYKSGAYTEKGTLTVKGKQFSLVSPQRSVWYNGKSLWTLNPSEKEVTLSEPTVAEASAINPYMLVSSYKTEYTARLVTSAVKGTYAIQLTPKNRSNYVKTATICLRASNYMPVRLDITDRSGNRSSIIISGIKTGQNISNSTFTYNSKKYPSVKLIDLR